jgi:hypothetical protein
MVLLQDIFNDQLLHQVEKKEEDHFHWLDFEKFLSFIQCSE